MALSEGARNRLYQYFSSTELGEEVTSEMLSHFPARDVDEPVTNEMLHQEITLLRMELRTELSDLRDELRGEFRAELRTEIHGLRDELRADIRQQFFWLLTTMLVVLGILSTLIVSLR